MAHILGMAGTIYFKSGALSSLICQHPHSKFCFAQTREHGAIIWTKNCTLLHRIGIISRVPNDSNIRQIINCYPL